MDVLINPFNHEPPLSFWKGWMIWQIPLFDKEICVISTVEDINNKVLKLLDDLVLILEQAIDC